MNKQTKLLLEVMDLIKSYEDLHYEMAQGFMLAMSDTSKAYYIREVDIATNQIKAIKEVYKVINKY